MGGFWLGWAEAYVTPIKPNPLIDRTSGLVYQIGGSDYIQWPRVRPF